MHRYTRRRPREEHPEFLGGPRYGRAQYLITGGASNMH